MRSIVAFGHPQQSRPGYDLPYTEREARKVAGLFETKALFTGEHATRESFFKNKNRYDIIHLAVHGEFNRPNPMESLLLFAGDPIGEGALTASEVLSSDLSDTKLVTLSAFETYKSRIASGDELIGFNRAFLAAGCPTVISNLWRVSNDSTAVLMREFYKNLINMNKVEALRKAELKLLYSKNFKSPFYWAPFILFGDFM